MDFLGDIVGITYFVCRYGFVTFEQLEDAEKLMKREVFVVVLVIIMMTVIFGCI